MSSGQFAASEQASRSTHSPNATIKPISSATGMNLASEIMPFSGLRQRNRDSNPLMRLAAISTPLENAIV